MRYRTDLTQGTDAWRAWRHQGLGASDALALLDLCPADWSPRPNPAGLWAEKRAERVQAAESTYAMRRGQALEVVGRRLHALATGWGWPPCCVEHTPYGWLRASLDGLAEWEPVAVEIKGPKLEYHRASLDAGRVPPHYLPQLWHQMLAGDLERVDYLSISDNAALTLDRVDQSTGKAWSVAIVPVLRDPEPLGLLLEVERWWWQTVGDGVWCERWPAQIRGMAERLRELSGAEQPRKRRKAGAA